MLHLWGARKRWWTLNRKDDKSWVHVPSRCKSLEWVSRAYFGKIATCETAKQAWVSFEVEVYGDEKVRTITLQTLKRVFHNLKMIESKKIYEYCKRFMNICIEIRNHSDTISNKQVTEKILISVNEKYQYIVSITGETKDLSKLFMKDLVR